MYDIVVRFGRDNWITILIVLSLGTVSMIGNRVAIWLRGRGSINLADRILRTIPFATAVRDKVLQLLVERALLSLRGLELPPAARDALSALKMHTIEEPKEPKEPKEPPAAASDTLRAAPPPEDEELGLEDIELHNRPLRLAPYAALALLCCNCGQMTVQDSKLANSLTDAGVQIAGALCERYEDRGGFVDFLCTVADAAPDVLRGMSTEAHMLDASRPIVPIRVVVSVPAGIADRFEEENRGDQ